MDPQHAVAPDHRFAIPRPIGASNPWPAPSGSAQLDQLRPVPAPRVVAPEVPAVPAEAERSRGGGVRAVELPSPDSDLAVLEEYSGVLLALVAPD